MHNFALAFYCSGLSTEHEGLDVHLDTPMRLWEQAAHILARFYQCSCHQHLQPTACLVTMAILHNLVPLQLERLHKRQGVAGCYGNSGNLSVEREMATLHWCAAVVEFHKETASNVVAVAA